MSNVDSIRIVLFFAKSSKSNDSSGKLGLLARKYQYYNRGVVFAATTHNRPLVVSLGSISGEGNKYLAKPEPMEFDERVATTDNPVRGDSNIKVALTSDVAKFNSSLVEPIFYEIDIYEIPVNVLKSKGDTIYLGEIDAQNWKVSSDYAPSPEITENSLIFNCVSPTASFMKASSDTVQSTSCMNIFGDGNCKATIGLVAKLHNQSKVLHEPRVIYLEADSYVYQPAYYNNANPLPIDKFLGLGGEKPYVVGGGLCYSLDFSSMSATFNADHGSTLSGSNYVASLGTPSAWNTEELRSSNATRTGVQRAMSTTNYNKIATIVSVEQISVGGTSLFKVTLSDNVSTEYLSGYTGSGLFGTSPVILLFPRCDKTITTCTNAFKNQANFNGSPHAPTASYISGTGVTASPGNRYYFS